MFNFLKKLLGPPKPDIITEKCEKDPNQKCGSYVEITLNGMIHRRNVLKCCKVFDTTKRICKGTASCEPDKDYNGISFSKSVIESAKTHYKEIKHISYVGPVCEANRVTVDE